MKLSQQRVLPTDPQLEAECLVKDPKLQTIGAVETVELNLFWRFCMDGGNMAGDEMMAAVSGFVAGCLAPAAGVVVSAHDWKPQIWPTSSSSVLLRVVPPPGWLACSSF